MCQVIASGIEPCSVLNRVRGSGASGHCTLRDPISRDYNCVEANTEIKFKKKQLFHQLELKVRPTTSKCNAKEQSGCFPPYSDPVMP